MNLYKLLNVLRLTVFLPIFPSTASSHAPDVHDTDPMVKPPATALRRGESMKAAIGSALGKPIHFSSDTPSSPTLEGAASKMHKEDTFQTPETWWAGKRVCFLSAHTSHESTEPAEHYVYRREGVTIPMDSDVRKRIQFARIP
ncbi:MAG: hypothetical protein H6849_05030 [Alphaproteobacteria bacterium]|nr:MAG: hypothetical protein H6849_05030 [Alphaproteobacteria bacterium]